MHTCFPRGAYPRTLHAVCCQQRDRLAAERSAPDGWRTEGTSTSASVAPGSAAEAPRAAELARAMPHDGGLCGGVGGAVFSDDENRILSWGGDNTVRLWDAATGRELVPAMRHDGGLCGGVGGAVVSDDESRVLSSWVKTTPSGCGMPPPATSLCRPCATMAASGDGSRSRWLRYVTRPSARASGGGL